MAREVRRIRRPAGKDELDAKLEKRAKEIAAKEIKERDRKIKQLENEIEILEADLTIATGQNESLRATLTKYREHAKSKK